MYISSFLPAETLTCGDSWNWSVSLPNYPASDGWVITLVFKAPGIAPISMVSVPDTDNLSHVLLSTSATTATYLPGRYKVQVFITSSDSQRQTVGLTEIELMPDLLSTTSDYDPRTKNELALQAISDVLDGSASREVLEEMFKDAQFKYKSTNELIRLKNYYQMEVNRDRGIKSGRYVL